MVEKTWFATACVTYQSRFKVKDNPKLTFS